MSSKKAKRRREYLVREKKREKIRKEKEIMENKLIEKKARLLGIKLN